jgi:hypothetical protein
MSAAAQPDYTALAAKYGGKPQVDYTALAKKYGGAPRIEGSEVVAQREADARGSKDDTNDHGLFHSFYDTAIKPIVDQVKDAYQRGDVGAHAADEILRDFLKQAGDFAASGGDIRKLPVIGTGATATAQRAQDQVNAGNPLGAVGSVAGFVAPFAVGGNAGDVADRVVATKDAIKASAAKNAELVSLGVKLAGKAAMKATGTGEVIGVLGKIAKATGEDSKAAEVIAPGVRPTLSAADLARQKNILEGRAADQAAARAAVPVEPAAAPAPAFESTPATATPSGRVPGSAARAGAARTTAETVPPANALPASDVSRVFDGIEFAPEATPPPAAAAAPAPAAPAVVSSPNAAPVPEASPVASQAEATPSAPAREPVPAISKQQRYEDAADAHAAYLQSQAETITWANRAHRADRFAKYFKKEKLDPTPENIVKATKELDERDAPSAETVDMIHDRLDYHAPAAGDAPAETALEQQLRDSLAAQAAKKGETPAAAPAPDAAPIPEDAPLKKRLAETLTPADPAAPKPGTLGQVAPHSLAVDPVRFQFKRDVGQKGVSDKLKSVGQYNPDLGGILSVWVDPADGKSYVVNGHHRLELAQRTNAKSVDVRYIDAPNATQARAKGAIINIAEDQGTAIDAAKVFRDTGISPAELKAQGVSLNGRVARTGLGLANLEQPIFDMVISGDITPENASAIGEALPNRFADQRAIVDAIDKAAARGKHMTPAQISESIRVGMRPGNEITETQDSLFGSTSETRSLFAETGELSDYIRKQLSQEKRLFGTVASNAAAERLAGAGNVMNAGENMRIASETTQAQAVYDKLSGMSGPVSDALAAGARDLAHGKNANAIKSSTYDAVRRAISETVSGGKSLVPEGSPRGNPGGSGSAAGAASGSEEVKAASPIKKRVRKIGDLGTLRGD